MKENFFGFFLRNTVAGLIGMLPLIAIVILLVKAYQFTHSLGVKLAGVSPDRDGSLLLVTILVILFLVVFCFLFGWLILPRSKARASNWVEKNILSNIPGYQLFKGVVSGLLSDGNQLRPALLERLPGVFELVLLIEELPGDRFTVFLPDSPGFNSGSVLIVGKELLDPLSAKITDLKDSLGVYGYGVGTLMEQRLKKRN